MPYQLLAELGVPKQNILLAYQAPHIRQYTDFAWLVHPSVQPTLRAAEIFEIERRLSG